jgi:hypothetical protein
LLDHSSGDYWSSSGEFEVEHCEIGESSLHFLSRLVDVTLTSLDAPH